MDDSRCFEYFLQPADALQRRYEALRAIFVEGKPQQEVAKQFGYQYGTLRQMIHDFRVTCRHGGPPPFSMAVSAGDRV